MRHRAILPALTLFAAVANLAPVPLPAAPLAAPEPVSARPEAHLVNGSNGYYHDFSKSQSRRKHRQWSLRTARVRGAWDVSRGRGVTVAIVDSGVGPTWELTGQVAAGTNLASRPPARVDLVDHGTAVACLIAARPGPHGITGVAPASTVLPVRIFDSYQAPASRVVRGIRWAASHGADVLNLSLVEKDSPELRAAVRYALRRNVIVVAGAGNLRASGSPVMYPAAYPGVIAVGAVDSHLELADFSNEGSYVDVVAAGDRVIACDAFSILSYYSGTSFSTPTVPPRPNGSSGRPRATWATRAGTGCSGPGSWMPSAPSGRPARCADVAVPRLALASSVRDAAPRERACRPRAHRSDARRAAAAGR